MLPGVATGSRPTMTFWLLLLLLPGVVHGFSCESSCVGLVSCEEYAPQTCAALEMLGCRCPACSPSCRSDHRRLQQEVKNVSLGEIYSLEKAAVEVTYDFVVVGGGSGGCAAARKLALAGYSTVVLERGVDDSAAPLTQTGVPGFAAVINDATVYEAFRFTDGVWGGVPKVLGGGSSLNAGYWVEESDAFFDDAGLSAHIPGIRAAYDDVRELLATPQADDEHALVPPSMEALVDALNPTATYRRRIPDDVTGPYLLEKFHTLRRKSRTGASRLCKEDNDLLDIATETTAHRILFDSGTAVGVRCTSSFFRKQNETILVDIRARRSVILAAGVIYTPALLMKSGVGDPMDLAKVSAVVGENFTTIAVNDAVGRNFIDRPTSTVTQVYKPLAIPPNGVDWFMSGPNVVDENGTTFSEIGGRGVQAHFAAASTALVAAEDRSPAFRQYIIDIFAALPCVRAFIDDSITQYAIVRRTPSRGNVTLDVNLNPVVNANAFATQDDVDLAKAAWATLIKIATNDVWAPYEAAAENRSINDFCPGIGIGLDLDSLALNTALGINSTDAIDAVLLKSNRYTSWHYFGTASLGTVVDPDTFQVIDVPRLHVLDASIFPVLTYANPQSTVMAVATHAASRIADFYADLPFA